MIKYCVICGKRIHNYIDHVRVHHNGHDIDEFIKINDDRYTGSCLISGCDNEVVKTKNTIGLRPYFCKKHSNGITLEKMIIIHGESLGKEKFDLYREKQSITNTFEYKNKKYNMSISEFHDYNKSRAVTLENCVRRHGNEKGEKIYRDYCEKQKTVGISLEYFQKKLGETEGKMFYENLNLSKTLNMETFIRKYGEVDGQKRFLDFIQNRKTNFYSKLSEELFNSIKNKTNFKKIYYAENEFGIYNKHKKEYYKYDFVCLDKNKIIEFNGEAFHPKSKYDKNFRNPYDETVKSFQVWEKDKEKKKCAEKNGFELIYIWEKEYNNNKEYTIKKCLDFLNG